MTTGYSGTPLVKKLGYKDECASIDELVLSEEEVPTPGILAAHIFVTERKALAEKLEALRQLIDPARFIWVSWPKKASNVKVCAIDETWSGLKLVVRKKRR